MLCLQRCNVVMEKSLCNINTLMQTLVTLDMCEQLINEALEEERRKRISRLSHEYEQCEDIDT